MKTIKFNPIVWSILTLIGISLLSCRNEKAERQLIGNWALVNSTLYALDSNSKVLHQAERIGEITLFKTKMEITRLNLNEGIWNFVNFPETIIPSSGSLVWSSTEKGENWVKLPWTIDLIFSNDFRKDFPNQVDSDFYSYRGNFKVTELKKKKHYRLEGTINRPMYDPSKPDYLFYKWVFELKKK
jgi:hypothetical protein